MFFEVRYLTPVVADSFMSGPFVCFSVTGQPIHKNDFVLVEKFSKKQSNGKSFWKYAKKNTAHLNTKNQVISIRFTGFI